MTIAIARDAFTRYVHCGDRNDLEMALAICKSLNVPHDILTSIEATVKQARAERPEKVRAWEALPPEERKAILEMSKG